jgi:chromosomal replication initiation ATPase DnaA
MNKLEILTKTAEAVGSDYKVVVGERRTRKASFARDICCFVLHILGFTHDDIGRGINRDRATVTHCIKRVKSRIFQDSNQGKLLKMRVRNLLDHDLNLHFINLEEYNNEELAEESR